MRKFASAPLAYALAATVVVLDQLSKYWVINVLDLPSRLHIDVTSFMRFSMVWNRGVSFGLFRSPEGQETIRWILAAFSLAVSIALIVWVRKTTRPLAAAGVGLIIGGAIGNLIDRVRLGAVADFLDFQPLLSWWIWVFNIADSAITVGVVLLLIDTIFAGEKDKPAL